MKTIASSALMLCVAGCAGTPVTEPTTGPLPAGSPPTVVAASEVEWQQLNPARPASPKAGTLWGDRSGSTPTGFLLRPSDGFESPPHIHNVSYRGVVIRGLIHNDDPGAEAMWMPAGAFWTQPKGAVHITSAQGADTLAYIEIEGGPYLVRPVDAAFSTEERPVNVDPTNIVWVDASRVGPGGSISAPAAVAGPQIAFLWGDPQDARPAGYLVKLPAGSSGAMINHGASARAVVMQGEPRLSASGGDGSAALGLGSLIAQTEPASTRLSCSDARDCVFYVRAEGRLDVVPAGPE